MNAITVKELIAILQRFDENLLVKVTGGEDGGGSWAELTVGEIKPFEFTDRYGNPAYYPQFSPIETIMEY